MTLPLSRRIQAFVSLGYTLQGILDAVEQNIDTPDAAAFTEVLRKTENANSWFAFRDSITAVKNILPWLEEQALDDWLRHYPAEKLENPASKTVAVIMAGNIPMVNFHDFISVVITGNRFLGKLSSSDPYLLPYIAGLLTRTEPELAAYIHFTEEKITGQEVVIATGSNNSSRYFEYYFSRYPHIIRKNRTSVAVLDGTETAEELQALGYDIFAFYGLGCRNVAKIFVPEGYDVIIPYPHWEIFSEVIHHHKYKNNYDYHKAIFLVNKDLFLDNGFLMIKFSENLHTPVGMIFAETYANKDDLAGKLQRISGEVQCIVGKGQPVGFGQSQQPTLLDYPDGADVVKFLLDVQEKM